MKTNAKNLDCYGTPPIEWERVQEVLNSDITQAPDTGGPNRHTAWLTTINPDGAPHVTPVGVIQLDGVRYFTSGPGTRKSRNIDADPRCVISIATQPFDLVIEGSAALVTDADELRSVADEYNRVGWPAQVAGDALTAEYSAPSAGPPPWHVYRITPDTVFAFGTAEPGGATRFDLSR
ncbi:pyridoxamine 5'-phosphate oxidase family protein [Mycobacterium sp. JS623]|uniref:pyridoxamine 5'-phosphate oxidase family protein n=1 Tax=Mycobacterium sp. JS623 TaxID=212767 RepID=UPI0012F85D64|nr:pyridoxamine 5'-phosphate oxidase family protein [Mycobacterium sp. JS623]